MGNDILKEHISNRRQEFEIYDFDTDSTWEGVADQLDEKQTKHVNIPIKYVWRVAAVLAISLGVTFYMTWSNLSQVRVSIELAEADAYYGDLITTKVLQIKSSSSQFDPTIFQDIDALDEAFMELKEDLKDNADNEEVINAMILNYKIKLEILEKILDEVESEKENSGSQKIENEG